MLQPQGTQKKWRNNICIYPLFVIISILFQSVFSLNTSPLYIGYGGDSANYLSMGNMLLNGLIPYLDFFDHKGPMVIFIQAFGQSIIPGRTGIFILQIINLSIILMLIFLTSKLFIDRIGSILVSLSALFFFSFTTEGGNMTEEYSLIFIMISIYLSSQLLIDQKYNIKPLHAFIIGLCASFLFWIRLNNMGVVCACFTFIFIVCIKLENKKHLFDFILYFILGFLVVSAPVLIYFMVKDALFDMIFAAFLYNLKYIGLNMPESPYETYRGTILHIFKAWMPFIILLIGTIMYFIKVKKYRIILWSVLLVGYSYITTHVGAAYYHYMTMNIPCLVFGLIFIIASLPDTVKKRKLIALTLIVLSAAFVVLSAFMYKKQGGGTDGDSFYISQAKELLDDIPLTERNSVFAYQTMTRFHATTGLMPHFRNFMMQEWQGKYNPQIIEDINNMMLTNPPTWVITQFRDQSTNAEFWEIIDEKYILFKKNTLFEMYRLRK